MTLPPVEGLKFTGLFKTILFMIFRHSDITQFAKLAPIRSRGGWLCVLMMLALLTGQWCQLVMATELPVEIAAESSSVADREIAINDDHSCCPDAVTFDSDSDNCDNCLDESLLDLRLGWFDSSVDLAASLWDKLLIFIDDGLVQYWRYCETLWSGLSRPIYLLISFFLE